MWNWCSTLCWSCCDLYVQQPWVIGESWYIVTVSLLGFQSEVLSSLESYLRTSTDCVLAPFPWLMVQWGCLYIRPLLFPPLFTMWLLGFIVSISFCIYLWWCVVLCHVASRSMVVVTFLIQCFSLFYFVFYIFAVGVALALPLCATTGLYFWAPLTYLFQTLGHINKIILLYLFYLKIILSILSWILCDDFWSYQCASLMRFT